MRRRLLACGEDPGAFERDVDAERLVRQLRRILDRRDFDLVAVNDHRVALDLDLVRKAPVDAVEAQEVGVGLHRAQIVDRDDLDVLAARLQNSAQHEPPDAAEAIDRYLGNHPRLSSRARLRSTDPPGPGSGARLLGESDGLMSDPRPKV